MREHLKGKINSSQREIVKVEKKSITKKRKNLKSKQETTLNYNILLSKGIRRWLFAWIVRRGNSGCALEKRACWGELKLQWSENIGCTHCKSPKLEDLECHIQNFWFSFFVCLKQLETTDSFKYGSNKIGVAFLTCQSGGR